MSWKRRFGRSWGRLGMKYKEYLMEDILDAIIDYRGKTPQKAENGIPTLSAKSVKNNRIDYSECYYISQEEYKRFMVRGFPQVGDVLMTTEAPLGVVARLDRDDVALAQRLLTLRGKPGILNNDYLLYLLQSPYGQALLKEKETGTTVTGIKQAAFRKIAVKIPDYQSQQRVGTLLRSIDERIANNEKINDHLEQQAAALFANLYDHAETEAGFTEIIQILGGGTPKTGESSYWNGNVPFFTPKDAGSPYTLTTEKRITEEGLAHCNSRLYPVNTVFVTARGTVGKVGLSGVPMAMNQSCYALVGKDTHPLLVYFYTLKAVDRLKHKASGAVFDAITTRDFESEIIMKLSDDDAKDFLDVAEPIYQAILSNSFENLRLAALRDSLLPKLISGELDVSSIPL